MRLLKVAAATLNQTPLDWDRNRDHIVAAIDEARRAGVGLLCLPELAITGYGCEDAFLSPGVTQTAATVLEEIVPHTTGLIVGVGLPVFHNKATYSTSCLIADGRILGLYAKRALAGDGIHYEPRWFKPWPRGERALLRLESGEYPIGDLFFDCGTIKIGFEICEDAWMAERPGAELALDAVDVILNPSASHFSFGKYGIRNRLVLEGSRAFGVSYVYANLLGNEAGRIIYDGDALIATAGELVARGQRFGFGDHQLLTAVIDIDLTRSRHARLSGYVPRVAPRPGECVQSEFAPPLARPSAASTELLPWECGENVKEEEFTRAITLALFDYMRKSRSRGFVVSLSGGADSTAVACLCALMVRFAVADIGIDGFKRRLDYMPELSALANEREIIQRLLLTVYQSTRNSSETTRAAARSVSEAIGARHLELDVDSIVGRYTALVEGALDRGLSWDRDDLALQNIQARARAPSVWMLANVRGALLLSTSNRSEAAVGYATMDGDTAGGLSPIAGIDKAFLRRWLRWLQTRGPDGFGPIPEVAAVTAQVPTAELRPLANEQTDEKDLMPYELLDAIERAAIRDKRMPKDVFELMRLEFPAVVEKDLLAWIERFFELWSRNQWKRERYAPSFHVDDANLDPKTWCRFPILSGGFERELDELRGRIASH